MANTEIMAVLRKIREAKRDLQHYRVDESNPCRQDFEGIFITLDTLEEELILGELEKKVEQLKSASGKLNYIIKEATRKGMELEAFAKKIDAITKAIGTLTDIAVKAATL